MGLSPTRATKEMNMARRKSYNPERRAWRGRSYKKHGERISELKQQLDEAGSRLGCAREELDMFLMPTAKYQGDS